MKYDVEEVDIGNGISGYILTRADPWYIRLGRWFFTKIGVLDK